ncbi:hypothetical protein [Candidatus Binatus sp.]|uniref:hypothetical protein n=1 Tax=Candidatus Binatus sp. TaxID=2811406 RepID=UPI002F945825
MGYAALFLALLTRLPISDIWSDKPTLNSVLALLSLIVLTYLFESLKTTFTRWLCGNAVWIPKSLTEYWQTKQESKRHDLDNRLREVTDQLAEWPIEKKKWETELNDLVTHAQQASVANATIGKMKAKARAYVLRSDKSYIADVNAMVMELSEACSTAAGRDAVIDARFELEVLMESIAGSLGSRLSELLSFA